MTEYDGPRCHRHEAVVSSHGVWPSSLPAHEWSGPPSPPSTPGCLRCGGGFVKGDRYLCDDGGIVHVTCPEPGKPPAWPNQGGDA